MCHTAHDICFRSEEKFEMSPEVINYVPLILFQVNAKFEKIIARSAFHYYSLVTDASC